MADEQPTPPGNPPVFNPKFGAKARATMSKSQLAYMTKVVRHLKKIGKYDEFVKGGTINIPDLRRIADSAFFKRNQPAREKSGWAQWENKLRNKEFRDPNYTGPEAGKYGKGAAEAGTDWLDKIIGGLTDQQRKQYFRGSGTNMGDLRRLYRAGVLDEENQNKLGDFLGKERNRDDDDPPPGPGDPPPGPEGPGGGGPDYGDGPPRTKKPPVSQPPPFDPGMWEAMKNRIMSTLEQPGFDPVLLENMKNAQRAGTQVDIRDMTQNASERFAERGISDSGIAERGFQDIESGAREGLADNIAGIDIQNAQAALQAVRDAMQGALGMDAANLSRFQLELQAEMQAFMEMAHGDNVMMQWFQLKLQEHLGQGQLDLARLYYELAFDQNFWDWYFKYAGLPNIPGPAGADPANTDTFTDPSRGQDNFTSGQTAAPAAPAGFNKTVNDPTSGQTGIFSDVATDNFGVGADAFRAPADPVTTTRPMLESVVGGYPPRDFGLPKQQNTDPEMERFFNSVIRF